MQGSSYIESLPLAERLYRYQPDLAAKIYSDPIQQFLADGVVILPGVIPLDVLDQFDRDLETLANLEAAPEILGSIVIDGPKKYYEARFLRNLGARDFRQEPPLEVS